MREKLVKSMAMQVKAQMHEESKLWSTSQPFAKPIKDVRRKARGRNPTTSSFAWLCEISHTMRNLLRQLEDFAHHAKFRMVCKIFLCTDSIRFLSSDILCNFLVSPCNQPRYFLLFFFIYLLGSRYIRREICVIQRCMVFSLDTCKFPQ